MSEFPKYASTLAGPYDEIVLPPESTCVDYEGELAGVIGRRGRCIAAADALDYVLGFTISNDVTVRDFQARTHQFLQERSGIGPPHWAR